MDSVLVVLHYGKMMNYSMMFILNNILDIMVLKL